MKEKGGFRVRIRRGEREVKAPAKEVGPWNTTENYNNGKDQFGRKVLNPAGVDLTPRVARRLGLEKYQNAWVRVRYSWVRG